MKILNLKSKALSLFNKLRKFAKQKLVSFSNLMSFCYKAVSGKSFSFIKKDSDVVREMVIENIVSIRETGQVLVNEFGIEGIKSFYIQNIL